MFDLSQANYLVHRRSQDPPSSPPSAHVLTLNDHFYQSLCNSVLDQPKDESGRNGGKWSLRQIMRYYLFLVEFKYLFKSKELRKAKRVFSHMAKHVRSRKTSQCKSHHQKIEKYYGGIQDIISHFRSILSPLKEQWEQFERTQNHVLINEYPEVNSSQNYYQIFEFKNCIKIYINKSSIQTYEI